MEGIHEACGLVFCFSSNTIDPERLATVIPYKLVNSFPAENSVHCCEHSPEGALTLHTKTSVAESEILTD